MDQIREAFVNYVTYIDEKIIYLTQKTQIAFLLVEEITVLDEYLDFADNFLKK